MCDIGLERLRLGIRTDNIIGYVTVDKLYDSKYSLISDCFIIVLKSQYYYFEDNSFTVRFILFQDYEFYRGELILSSIQILRTELEKASSD